MKVDLHGMRTRDAIERFIRDYNSAAERGDERLEVVHGYGSSGVGGDIKEALAALLDAHPDKVRYIKGEVIGNKGVTVVIPDDRLPSRTASLDKVILKSMAAGKALSIYGIEAKLSGFATADEISRSLSFLVDRNLVMKIIQSGRLLYSKR